MDLSIEELKKVEEYTNTAVSIFSFLQNIPSPLGEFIFKRIVDDAYSIADFIKEDDAKDQLIESICSSIDASKELDLVFRYLDINSSKDIDPYIMEKDKLVDILSKKCNFSTGLPDKSKLIKAYECFSPNSVCNEFVNNLKEKAHQRIYLLVKKKDIESDPFKNVFIGIGYKNLFINWSCQNLPEYDDLIFNWYCKGKILNVVFDTAFKCDVNIISRLLIQHIKKECENDSFLSKAFQEIYNSYKKCALVPEMKFDTNAPESEDKPSAQSLALPEIKDKNGKEITYEQKTKLYSFLHDAKDIECSSEDFNNIFSGSPNRAKPIKWLSMMKRLAIFLYVAYGEKTNKKLAERAASLFLNEEGEPTKANTLKQPALGDKEETLKEYRKYFEGAKIREYEKSKF